MNREAAPISKSAIAATASTNAPVTSKSATAIVPAAVVPAANSQAPADPHLSELHDLGTKVLDYIPSKAQMRGLTDEEVHQIAKPIFEASLQLKLYGDKLEEAMKAAIQTGDVAQVAAQGADFYEKCAARDDAPESLRAVCFIEFSKFSAKSGHPENVSRLHMPHDVLEIALEIAPSA